MRKLCTFLLATALAAAPMAVTAAASATTTQAITPGLGYTLTNVNSGQVMDVSGGSTSPGAPVLQWPLHGGPNQRWTLAQVGSTGAYTVANVNSGLCLEAASASPTTAGGQLDQGTCGGAMSQQWNVQPVGDGSYTLANVGSGMVADVQGASQAPAAPVIQWPANQGANQHWRLTPILPAVGVWSAGLESNGPSFTNQTVRMVAHTSVAGSQVRVQLSNRFGTAPLNVGAVDIAVQSSGGTAVAGTHHTVLFKGAGSTAVAAGADLTSDPIPMAVNADQSLLVSVYLPTATGQSTWHADALNTTYLSSPGNHANDDATGNYPSTSTSWYFLAGLNVVPTTATGTVVAVGDSITDGYYSTSGANLRWPDDLARRLNAAPGGPTRGVVDTGIGSNRVLTDANTANHSLLSRFDHDVLGQPNVKDVILLEGINDIGSAGATAQQIIAGYQTVIGQAHAKGVKIYGATILPYQGANYYTASGESARESVNQWIRTSGAFDAVIDLDSAMRSSGNPLALNPAYDSGDHLHPSNAGHQAMADAVDLNLLSG